MTEGYLELTFGWVLNIYSLRNGNTAERTSLLISIIFMIFLLLYPFMTFALIYDNRK